MVAAATSDDVDSINERDVPPAWHSFFNLEGRESLIPAGAWVAKAQSVRGVLAQIPRNKACHVVGQGYG